MTAPTETKPAQNWQIEDNRTGMRADSLRRALADNLFYIQGKFPEIASIEDYYMALAYTVRDRVFQRWLATTQTYRQQKVRKVCYLSAEYLLGPHLGKNLINLGILEQTRQAVEASGLDLDQLLAQEEEPGLGNGGLGRLAAAYMDALATLQLPATGYGIRYEFGIFDQVIRDGWQVEVTDKWLQYGNPWDLPRPDQAVTVNFGGHTEPYTDNQGRYCVRWVPDFEVKGIPYDTPILGYRVNSANTLRLWKAEACESFDLRAFNVGDYYGAVNEKVVSENLTKVLYPNDEPIQGQQLRLRQQYFFVSCSLQDMIRFHLNQGKNLQSFHDQFAVQLNDTHPAIGIAELMRLLVDEHQLDWDSAWHIAQNTFAFTNHTLLSEALEKWPVSLFGSLLPRHLEIIYEINQRFLDRLRTKYMGDGHLSRLSLIEEGGEKSVRMAHLACVGSYAINGVAQLHTELLKKGVLKDFYQLWPEKFKSITNGVSPRRWMALSNPPLSRLITEKIGEDWPKNLTELKKLEAFAGDLEFCDRWRQAQQEVKQDLIERIEQLLGLEVDPNSLFDVHIKRIHEYKRQHLNVLHIITLYQQIKQHPDLNIVPRTFIFGGKAAPSYSRAKLIIKLINAVAEVVNNDPDVRARLKVAFLPNYNVKNSQAIYPAADLSEQISLAGKEASGTGNMKFALNGAITIGTLDGSNVEIRQAVGAENFFLFGMTAQEVSELRQQGYNPWDYYQSNSQLKTVIDLIRSGLFSHGDRDLFAPLVDSLLSEDQYMLLADYQSYIDCQKQVSQAFRDRDRWTRMSILNTARTGQFSADRAIREYCEQIWQIAPVEVELKEYAQTKEGLQVDSGVDAL